MSAGKSRFRYPLEPVALTRQWALDALLLTLGESNAALAASTAERDVLQAQLRQASSEWTGLGGEGQGVSVDSFALAARYLHDRARRLREAEQQVQQRQQECDEVAARLAAAQRAVEATDEHRAMMRRAFMKSRDSAEFKTADDQWNVKQAGVSTHDN